MTAQAFSTAGVVDAAVVAERYERLRAWVPDGPGAGTRPVGLIVLLRQGLATWLQEAALGLPAPSAPGPTPGQSAPGKRPPTDRLVQQMASMLERRRTEGTP
jgi:hypothetical protein